MFKDITIQNKWHSGRRWKFKFTLAAIISIKKIPTLVSTLLVSSAVNLVLALSLESFCVYFLVIVFGISSMDS
jgi:hypothetical protein